MSAATEIIAGNLRHQASRFIGPALGVILGVLFVTAALVLGASMNQGVLDSLASDYTDYSAVVTARTAGDPLPPASLAAATGAAGVERVDPVAEADLQDVEGTFLEAASVPGPHSKARLDKGRYPTGRGEVAASTVVAHTVGLKPGDRLQVRSSRGGTRALRVVGLVDAGRDSRYGSSTPVVFGTYEGVRQWAGNNVLREIDVVAHDGMDDTVVARAVQRAVGTGPVVRTGTEQAQVQTKRLTGGTDVISGVFLGFAAIACLVSMLVISNTFAILLARRRRETALLRAVGATRRQLFMSSSVEAVVVGLVAAVTGTVVGVATSAALLWLLNRLGALGDLPLTVPWYAMVVPVVVGTGVTLAASLLPVMRATRVSPMVALRPEAAPTAASRAGRIRVASAVVLTLLGAGWLMLGVSSGQVLIGAVGGGLSFLGVLLLGPVLLPPLIRVLTAPGQRLLRRSALAVPGELAVENTVRSPARAAATANALLVGVTLVAMTLVGAGTAQASVDSAMDREYPVDLTVQARSGSHTPVDVKAVERVGGVSGAAATGSVALRLPGSSRPVEGTVLTPAAAATIRNRDLTQGLTTGTVTMGRDAAGAAGVRDGQRVAARGSDGTRTLTVHVTPVEGGAAMLTPGDASALQHRRTAGPVLVRLRDGADANRVVDAVRDVTPRGSVLSGAAPERARLSSVLNIVVGVVAGLLGISVLIALIGVGNTLSLSAIERSGESALLRALGLTRRQLRASLAIEGALLAVIGGLLGVVLGTVYGWLGVRTLLHDSIPTILDVPWGRVLLVLAVTLLAGALASALPGRRAARTPPAQVLAVE